MNVCHNCDCMELMKTKPDNYYDLAIVDPPYGIGVDGKNIIPNKSGDKNHNFDNSKKWDIDIPNKDYFLDIIRVSKNQIIWGGNYFLDFLGYCKAPIVWDKLNGKNIYADGEIAWTGGVEIPKNLKIFKHQWCGAFKASERNTIKIHPTQKPVALYKWILKNYAKPGWKIFDSHVGSGSLRIACHDLGFWFEGCEIDRDYWQSQEERFQNHIANRNLPSLEPEDLQEYIFSQGKIDYD